MTSSAAVAKIDKTLSFARSDEVLGRATWSPKSMSASAPNPHGTGLMGRKMHFRPPNPLITARSQIGEPCDTSYIHSGLGSHSEQYRSNSLAGAGRSVWSIGRHPQFGNIIENDLSDATFLVLTMPPIVAVEAYKSICEHRQSAGRTPLRARQHSTGWDGSDNGSV